VPLLRDVVDLLRARGTPFALIGAGAMAAHGVSRAVQGVAVPVVGRAELILLKLYAAGPQDAWDIEQLLDSAERMTMVALVEEIDRRIGDLPEDSGRLWQRIRERRPR
jgi:hypothetical protein